MAKALKFTAEDYEDFYRYTEGASALREMMKQAAETERTLQRILTNWPEIQDALDAADAMEPPQ